MALEPGWLANVQGGLIAAAILGLAFAWSKRKRLAGRIALAAGAIATLLVLYHSLRDYLFVPAILLRPVPAWKPLLLGLGAAAALLLGFVVLLILDSRGPGEPLPFETWGALTDDEQTILSTTWNLKDGYLGRWDLEEIEKRLGHGRWNAAIHLLKSKDLIRHAGMADGYTLTNRARNLLVGIQLME